MIDAEPITDGGQEHVVNGVLRFLAHRPHLGERNVEGSKVVVDAALGHDRRQRANRNPGEPCQGTDRPGNSICRVSRVPKGNQRHRSDPLHEIIRGPSDPAKLVANDCLCESGTIQIFSLRRGLHRTEVLASWCEVEQRCAEQHGPLPVSDCVMQLKDDGCLAAWEAFKNGDSPKRSIPIEIGHALAPRVFQNVVPGRPGRHLEAAHVEVEVEVGIKNQPRSRQPALIDHALTKHGVDARCAIKSIEQLVPVWSSFGDE